MQGLKAYQSILDLPETPDLAILVLPTAIVADVLEECGKKGVKHAIVVSGGFNEVGGEGTELQEQGWSAWRKNTASVFSAPTVSARPIPTQAEHHLPRVFATPGFIGMASQSGSFITQMFDYLEKSWDWGSAPGSAWETRPTSISWTAWSIWPKTPTPRLSPFISKLFGAEGSLSARLEPFRLENPSWPFMWEDPKREDKAGLSHTGALAGPDKVL